ncbi:TIGR03560 family F420-dependent LLM class oxidoreductase [Streptomyces sp. RS10V-4]|uniref:TIGR03560 family F420-dependent LLM class oxidoreductase n=1 Tax=Streptomyces rhizoryzae TaxID=2932493 RepID=UPI002003D1D5|nr:TIGR03560 family F420-dependent LLM class oxidoreductase [Streptomyces rhizoryzae]MCK7624496.1 TIGR03560 family F420-dependent LLM class oxidoreductase [Streptomyces rhizoryzae]
MTLRLLVEPQQGTTYDAVSTFARRAEALGFEALMTSDHLVRIGDGDPGPGPLHAWTLLAGLARDTHRMRLGTLMSAATFHHAPVLALMAGQVDAMSGGRLELGVGAAWYEREHQAYGIPFPSVTERFSRLEETLEVIRRLWTAAPGAEVSYQGRHLRLDRCPALPRPVRTPHPPLIVGGLGKRWTPRLAARYADEFNVPFTTPEQVRAAAGRVAAAAAEAGREPGEITVSASLVLCPGRDRAALARRVADTGEPAAEIAGFGAVGSPEQVAEVLRAYRDAGAERCYAQINNPLDLALLDELAEVAALAGLRLPG